MIANQPTTARALLAPVVGIALVISGCHSAPPKSPTQTATNTLWPGPSNARCPIMPDLDIDGQTSVVWRSKRVGFCCAECIEKWDRLGDAEKDAALAEAMSRR
ncbi:MAG: hypothetical protein ACOYN0_06430 [Phycisphaerales bacterium]